MGVEKNRKLNEQGGGGGGGGLIQSCSSANQPFQTSLFGIDREVLLISLRRGHRREKTVQGFDNITVAYLDQ